MSKLPKWIVPGVSYSHGKRRYHVRGIVDGMVVLREWWPSKQYWNYTVEHPVFYEMFEDRCVKRKLRGALTKDQPS